MNNKGFTLTELLATIVVLAIIAGITLGIVNVNFGKTKESTEEVFVDTIKDAMNVYLDSSDAKLLTFTECCNELYKTHGSVKVYKAVTDFSNVINSEYHPITQSDLVNPGNDGVACSNAINIEINIYRDDDYVYYYKINKSEFGCLLNTSDPYISDLPVIDYVTNERFSCD